MNFLVINLKKYFFTIILTLFTISLIINNVISANTRDIKNVPLSFYNYEKYRLIHILGYRTKI